MVYREIIIDADFCIKLGSSKKYPYLETVLSLLADRIYIHEIVNGEVKTPRDQLDRLISSGKVSIFKELDLSASEKAIYDATYNRLAAVMINPNQPNKNKGETKSLSAAKIKNIPYFVTDEHDLQPIIDASLNTGMTDIYCKRIIDIIDLIKDGKLGHLTRKDAKLIWIISRKDKTIFDKEIWPLNT